MLAERVTSRPSIERAFWRGRSLVACKPLPDELARGLKGRIGRLNGYRSEDDLNGAIRAAVGTESSDVDFSLLDLGVLVGLDRRTLLCAHTMLPLNRGIADVSGNFAHGDDNDKSWRISTLLDPLRPGAYFCRECNREDIEFHGVSYWRRDHQVPARFWCSKHAAPLSVASAARAFYASPVFHEATARTVDPNWVNTIRANPAVGRFIELQSELLTRRVPLSKRGVRRLTRELCLNHDLHFGRGDSRRGKRSLRGVLVEAYDEKWLALALGSVERSDAEPLRCLDRGVDRISIGASLAVVALLSDDAQEALTALLRAGEVVAEAGRERSEPISFDQLRRAYVRNEGRHGKVAEELDRRVTTIRYRLNQAGLPTLHNRSTERLDSVLAAFVFSGMSLPEACGNDAETIAQVEALLRVTAENLANATRDIARSGSARRSRTLPLPPSIP